MSPKHLSWTIVATSAWAIPVVQAQPAPSGCETNRAVITQKRGIVFESANVSPGQWYWKLVEVVWCEPGPGGGKVNIFYKCKNSVGTYLTGQKCIAAYPFETQANRISIQTKAPPEWGDFAMSGGNWCPFWPECNCHGPYSAWVDSFCPTSGPACPQQASYPSDKVRGMGLPCNGHESYYLTWQFTQAAAPPTPAIECSPVSLTRGVRLGGNLPDDSFTVRNSGGGTLNYTITTNASWLDAIPSAGTSTGETDIIALSYAVASLGLGTYTAAISIADAGASNSPQTISVNLTVEPPAYRGDLDLDGDVDQSDFGHFQICLTGPGYPQAEPVCAGARLDSDDDVDLDDFGIFQACFSGPGRQPPSSCLK